MSALQDGPFPQHGHRLKRLGTIGLMLLSGCAGSPDRHAAARAGHEEGDPAFVESVARAAETERPGDGVLWKLERGLALRRLGRLQESIRALEEAEEALRVEEERPGFSAVDSVSSLLANDLSRPYAAKPVERIFASTYQALNRLVGSAGISTAATTRSRQRSRGSPAQGRRRSGQQDFHPVPPGTY